MADAVLNKTVYQGDKKLITHYQNVSDSSGGTTTVVDVSGLTKDKNGTACSTVTLYKVWYSVSMTAKVDAVKLTWDATTDATFLTVEQSGFLDYSSIGGIPNNNAPLTAFGFSKRFSMKSLNPNPIKTAGRVPINKNSRK